MLMVVKAPFDTPKRMVRIDSAGTDLNDDIKKSGMKQHLASAANKTDVFEQNFV